MKKLALFSIGLLLIAATVLGFASAETETTYYMYDNGEWRVCNGEEAIVAAEAMNRETPVSLSRENFNTLLNSHEPFWKYNTLDPIDDDTVTPVPTPTITPVPTQTPASKTFWDSIFNDRLPKGNHNAPSKWLNRVR
jgi:hypothetical protein